MALNLGQTVRYTDTKGHSKAAIVTGTSESVVEGSGLYTINPGYYNLTVFSPSGKVYPKQSVPDSNEENFDATDYTNEEGVLIGVVEAI